MRTLLVVTLLMLLPSADANAQTDFSTLNARVGDRVWVTSPSGVEVGGVVTELTPSRLSIDQYRFEPEPRLTIEREGDSLLNGILIGTVAGGLVGGSLAAEACLESSTANCVVGGAIAYGLVGALIDWLIDGRTVIFRGSAPAAGVIRRVAPLVTRETRGVSVTVSF